MQNDIESPLKNAFIKFVKCHNKFDGEIMEVCNHIDEANKALQKLPYDVQNELGQMILSTLAANGILTIRL